MKVILLKELKGRGGEGDVIEVANGYANNYLLTQGYAIKATKGNLKQLEQRKHNIAKREETRLADAETMRTKLDVAGEHAVAISIYRDIKATVTVNVVSDKAPEAPEEEEAVEAPAEEAAAPAEETEAAAE